jgi:tetratricopeptide (TPR) repeat protein
VLANLGYGWTLLYEAEVDEYHDFKAASDLFNMVTHRYPLSAEAWTSSGVAHSQMNEPADAQRDFEKALSIDPAHAEAYRGLGVLALRQGDFKKASESFEKALALRPDSIDDALSLAGALGDGGDLARAIAVAERARDTHPADAAPLATLGTLAAATTYADRALALAPDDGKALLLKGKLQLARQEYAGALRTFQRAADLLPTSFEAHHNAAALLLKNQSFEAAVPYLLRAYELRPVGSRGASGEVLRQTLLKMDIRDPELLTKLAAIDAQNGHDADAEEWIARALALKPDHGPTHYLKGSLARKRGDRETAVAEWRKAGEAMPESAIVHESLGMLLVELKRPAEALPPLESALAIATREPTNDENDRRAIEMLRETIERVKQDAR